MRDKVISSFELIGERTIVKRIDQSLLKYGEIRIPNYLRDYFHFHEMEKHDRWDIHIRYSQRGYDGVLYLDDYKRLRGKLRWGKDLTRALSNSISSYVYEESLEVEAPLIRLEKIHRTAFHLDIIFPDEVRRDAAEYREHGDRFIYGVRSRYELDPEIRIQVLKIHGTSCAVCGLHYEDLYGDLGRGYIQVHHTGSVEAQPESLDFERDFIPICENCHGIIHRSREHMVELSELRQIVGFRKTLLSTEKAED